ncbi:hypothetical protein IJ182_09485 [bacterium]|nr:hypothetical protein [bacterium]
MADLKNLETPIATYDATLLKSVRIEVLHSEYRDSAVGKYYAYICYYDEYGRREDFGTTGDFDTPQEALENLQKEWATKWSKLLIKSIADIK